MPARETLELSISIAARPATIFPLIATPEGLSRWLGAAASFTPRAGSPFRVDFARFHTVVEGEVLEIVPERKVVFSWGVAEGAQQASVPSGSTRVEIHLQPQPDGGTRVTLRHLGLPSVEEKQNHLVGWRAYLAQLSEHGNREAHASDLEALVDDYLAAWSEPDTARRQSLIERCCCTDVQVIDTHTLVRDRTALDSQMVNAQRFMPGLRLVRTGTPQLTHHRATYAWEVRTADGQSMGHGRHFVELAPSGQLSQITGFMDSTG